MTPLCVDPDLIDEFWPHVRSLIEMAFWSGRGDDSANVIYRDLKDRKSLLWIIWDESDQYIACALVTKLFAVDRGKVCVVAAVAGNRMDRWFHFFKVIEDYAKDEGCKFIRFSGRRGWAHYFPDWYEPWITLEKEL